MTTKIVHLVDDTNPGGVMRGLNYLQKTEALGPNATSVVIAVRRGAISAPKLDADLIVSHLSISWRNLPMLIALRARYAHLPLIHVEHSYSEAFADLNVRARRRFANLLRVSYALFNRVVAVSRSQADWMTREALVRPEALRVISTSVDLDTFLKIAPATGREARVIGAIGRFHRQKGFADLIAAFRAAAGPDQLLRLIGDGPEAAALREAAGGDPRIEFRPFTDDPAAAYAGCDVIAVPSLWEPYGLVALEARAAGRPVLATAVDGLEDQIEEGCVRVAKDGWTAAIAELPRAVHTARIAAARREAVKQNQRFSNEWRRLVTELTRPAAIHDGFVIGAAEAA